jgi:hypothetical protein
MSKRKNYKIIEKLKSIKRVKNADSKASLFHECGIPEQTIHDWMKEENYFHL